MTLHRRIAALERLHRPSPHMIAAAHARAFDALSPADRAAAAVAAYRRLITGAPTSMPFPSASPRQAYFDMLGKDAQ